MKQARQAAVVGVGTVVGGYITLLLWNFLFRTDSLVTPGFIAVVLLPCVLIAWALAACSLRLTRGVAFGGRVLSLVLWQAAVPVLWGFAVIAWIAVTSADVWGSAKWFPALALIGIVAWIVSLAPVFATLLGRRVLRDDPSNGSAVTAPRDERDEDVEVGAGSISA